MKPWLSVVGIGEAGPDSLSKSGQALIDAAELLIGHDRHLAMLPDDGRPRLRWPKPLKAAIPEIEKRRGQRVCVLASGDPSWFGILRSLLRRIPIEEMVVVPSPSSFSLACARLGWTLADVETLTLHWRPVEALHPFVLPGNRLLILSRDGSTPSEVARLLIARGYGQSHVTALAHMGGPREEIFDGTAATWSEISIPSLNTLAVTCVAEAGAALLPRVPGLPDDAFRNDGQLTKREVRAATLAALAPVPGQLLWDVGAGCGSVAIEWLRAEPHTQAIAVEQRADRVALIAGNASALGTPHLEVVTGAAPDELGDLAAPDAVFIGGGLTAEGLCERCWQALTPGGRLVANAVTLEGERALFDWRDAIGGDLTRIAVSHAAPVGGRTGWRPLMQVTQFAARKS